jgi:hypothetical protein
MEVSNSKVDHHTINNQNQEQNHEQITDGSSEPDPDIIKETDEREKQTEVKEVKREQKREKRIRGREISVDPDYGDAQSFDVEPNQTIAELKKQIRSRKMVSLCGGPNEDFNLIFKGRLLFDYNKLSDYHIEEYATLYMRYSRKENQYGCELQINVIQDSVPTRTIPLSVHLSMKVSTIKHMILDCEGIPIARQRLFYIAKFFYTHDTTCYTLDDQSTLSKYFSVGTCSNQPKSLDLIVQQEGAPEMFYIKPLFDMVNVLPDYTPIPMSTSNVKEEISRITGIPEEEVCLETENGSFDPEESRISGQSQLVTFRQRKQAPSRIFIKTLTDRTFEVNVGSAWTEKDLREEICMRDGVLPPDQQRLVHNHHQLKTREHWQAMTLEKTTRFI